MLAAADRTALLDLARATVRAASTGALAPPVPAGAPALAALAGAFVTLRDPDGGLRGCIGYIEAKNPLHETVRAAAREAAISDPRFEPVTPVEAAALSIEISVLSAIAPAEASSVRPGLHGVVLSRGPRRGLLLPQVATENGWNVEQFLEACCDKAGLPRTAWRDGSAKIEIFTAEVFGS
ncbi:MAG: AmmeMemoRadiSam system protein A [Planctomycetes bacterium]|nr:AmmeMemoRadiSam system protein A [Planctomycetota bacterium]